MSKFLAWLHIIKCTLIFGHVFRSLWFRRTYWPTSSDIKLCTIPFACILFVVSKASSYLLVPLNCSVFSRYFLVVLPCGIILSLGQTLSTFHYTLLDKCRALLSVVERGWPNALDFSLDLELNIPRMYYLMNNSFMECFVHYLTNSNCTCVRSTTLDNFALDQTSLDKVQSSRLQSTRWPNALDISLNMHVERCIVKSRERLARALFSIIILKSLYHGVLISSFSIA